MVTVDGTKVPEGTYLIFTWPAQRNGLFLLYKRDLDRGGNTADYDKTKEVAHFKVKSEKLTEKVETLTFNITDILLKQVAKIQMAWDKTLQ